VIFLAEKEKAAPLQRGLSQSASKVGEFKFDLASTGFKSQTWLTRLQLLQIDSTVLVPCNSVYKLI
jgi:hypothetical protein